MNQERKICFIASIPAMIMYFYGGLLKRLQAEGWKTCVIASRGPELENISESYGSKTVVKEITRTINPLKDLLAVLSMTFFLRDNKYSIVHAHTPKGGLVGMAASWLSCVPVRIYTMHGLPLETATGFKRKLLWQAEKTTCRLATHVLSVSESLKERAVEEQVCPRDKISILAEGTACGVNIERFSKNQQVIQQAAGLRRELGILESETVIGFVGRITPEKGIEVLIRSFLNVQAHHEVSLLLVGELDNIREKLSTEVLDVIRQNKKIFSVGHQSNPVHYYAAMDIFVMPTRREGFGMTFLEANAMELPVIGCRVTGAVNAVADHETGFLVEVDDSGQLTKAIETLIEDEELREQMGKAGRQRVISCFDSNRLIREHIRLYENLRST